MRALRCHRGWVSGWLVAVLLFGQLATAAYACPQRAQPLQAGHSTAPQQGAAAAAAPAAVAAMPAMPDCAGKMATTMDPEQPQLCKAHCQAGASSVNSQPAVPDAPPAPALAAALVGVVDPVDVALRAASMPATLAAGPPAGAPPLYLSLLVLRN